MIKAGRPVLGLDPAYHYLDTFQVSTRKRTDLDEKSVGVYSVWNHSYQIGFQCTIYLVDEVVVELVVKWVVVYTKGNWSQVCPGALRIGGELGSSIHKRRSQSGI